MKKQYGRYVNTKELKRVREELGISYREMSKLMGFKSSATYYNIENGIVEAKISHINAISKILHKASTIFFNFEVQ